MKTRNVLLILLATAAILAIPLVAVQLTEEVNWTLSDFIVAGALLAGTGLLYEWASSRSGNTAYRAGVGLALGTALFLVWVNLAVGIIGTEDNPANLMYLGVLAVAFIGAFIVRLQPQGMARVLVATATAQILVGVIALVSGLDTPASGPLEISMVNGLFAALWIVSALLFERAMSAAS